MKEDFIYAFQVQFAVNFRLEGWLMLTQLDGLPIYTVKESMFTDVTRIIFIQVFLTRDRIPIIVKSTNSLFWISL